MRDLIKKVPIPTAGVALGLAALGNLLASYGEGLHMLCGVLSFALIALLAAKAVLFPSLIQDDLRNSILASVSATAFMTLMQLAAYAAPVAYLPALVLWSAAVLAHFALMAWFTWRFIRNFKLPEVFPTYFICYVGIVVASVSSPTFGLEQLGYGIFWFGFACYVVLLAVVTYRYTKHEVPESARPLFCIYAAPMSLSLTGYLATAAEPNLTFAATLLVLAQALFAVVLVQLPKLVRLAFYPSFAAMTFPFVITATALGKSLDLFAQAGAIAPQALYMLLGAETLLASVMVAFVLCHYVRFFIGRVEQPKSAAVMGESRQIARFAENFED